MYVCICIDNSISFQYSTDICHSFVQLFLTSRSVLFMNFSLIPFISIISIAFYFGVGEYYQKDGIKLREPSHIECRAMLEDPLTQQAVGNFAKEMKAMEIFMCWYDFWCI